MEHTISRRLYLKLWGTPRSLHGADIGGETVRSHVTRYTRGLHGADIGAMREALETEDE